MAATLKACDSVGLSMPVSLPAEVMLATDMEYDSIRQGRLDARVRRRDRHGRDNLHGRALQRCLI